MNRVSSVVAALAAAFALVSAAEAHHSAAVFYQVDKEITVEGVVTSYTLGNPHARIYMTVKGPNGKDQEWLAEGGSRTVLLRNGWTGDEVKPGDRDQDHRQPVARRHERRALAEARAGRRQGALGRGRADAERARSIFGTARTDYSAARLRRRGHRQTALREQLRASRDYSRAAIVRWTRSIDRRRRVQGLPAAEGDSR